MLTFKPEEIKLVKYKQEDKNDQIAVINGGFGDFVAMESYMTDEERDWFNNVYQIGYRPALYQPMFQSYRNIKKYRYFWDFAPPHELHELRKNILKHLTGRLYIRNDMFVEINQGKRKYNGSTFMRNNLASLEKFNLPSEFFVLCPSTLNAHYHWKHRKFKQSNWPSIIRFLESEQKPGILIGLEQTSTQHPLIINLSNKTTILEAFEITKQSQGYIGIDTVFSVIASKTTTRPLVQANKRDYAYQNREIYYRGNAFLVPEITENVIQQWLR